jgi:hypothetical protein
MSAAILVIPARPIKRSVGRKSGEIRRAVQFRRSSWRTFCAVSGFQQDTHREFTGFPQQARDLST